MAVVRVGKSLVVSLSPTALSRRNAIAHILIERLNKPATTAYGTKPVDAGFHCRVACGLRIMATMDATYIHQRGKPTLRLQHHVDCKRCRVSHAGGEVEIRLLAPGTNEGWQPPAIGLTYGLLD